MKIDKYFHLYGDKDGVNVHFEEISPPTEKQTDTAEWEYNSFSDKWRCTKCFQSNNEKTKYCPNCGRRMERR